MKEYPKTYENYFQGIEDRARTIQPEKYYFGEKMEKEEFEKFYRQLLKEYFQNVWIAVVRNAWLAFHFQREGEPTYGDALLKSSPYGPGAKSLSNKAVYAGKMFGLYPRLKLGIDRRAMVEGFAFRQAATYVFDFYTKERLLADNPFTNPEKFPFPYQNISLDFLLSVYQLEERLELLKIAEERCMTWPQFMDYVLNYTSCYNEEHGKRIFQVVARQPFPTYFKDARRLRSVWSSVGSRGKKGVPLFEESVQGSVEKL